MSTLTQDLASKLPINFSENHDSDEEAHWGKAEITTKDGEKLEVAYPIDEASA